MKKIIFSIIFSLFIAVGATTIQAAVNEGNIEVALVKKGDDDKKKKKKCASKKKCCATENGEKKCSPKTE